MEQRHELSEVEVEDQQDEQLEGKKLQAHEK